MTKLKLNHNGFGTAGLVRLVEGLATNRTLEKLSLKYCGIDSEGAKSIQRVLASIESKLEGLKLQGNQLKNDGCMEVFRALHINSVLQKVSLGDNLIDMIGSSGELINKICDVMRTNETIMHYDLSNNMMSEENAKRIINEVRLNTAICKVNLWEQLPRDLQEELTALTKKRKPKKKKGKKGKKKKDKKK